MDWAANLDAAAFGALVAAASGVLVPRIIERVPEPEPDEPDRAADAGETRRQEPAADGGRPGTRRGSRARSEPEEPPKEPYDAIADLPGLLWKSRARPRVSPAG